MKLNHIVFSLLFFIIIQGPSALADGRVSNSSNSKRDKSSTIIFKIVDYSKASFGLSFHDEEGNVRLNAVCAMIGGCDWLYYIDSYGADWGKIKRISSMAGIAGHNRHEELLRKFIRWGQAAQPEKPLYVKLKVPKDIDGHASFLGASFELEDLEEKSNRSAKSDLESMILEAF